MMNAKKKTKQNGTGSKSQKERRKSFLLNFLGMLGLAIPLVWAAIAIYNNEKISTKDKSTNTISLDDIKLSSLSGEKIDMSEFEGKTVFINFWATWCGPCIQEMPTIEKAQTLMKGKDVVFLFASNEELDQIERFSKKKDYNFRFVQLNNMEELKIPALPTTFIFDTDGVLKFSETGSRRWDESTNIELITKIINHEE
ncbi:MAG TPA: TlpA disulfide reductase family protein [Cyclobacteriaceae bacterium]|nr:TlpA family protein disulfide reductase [Cyclobacteriaceae bacterium]HMW99188.1 TlpA disulfide reductase family protein [Cyclobacteriaceae bacterium]HNE96309.1 TlpA disulfide reductase family protein [Cyclobacteriaceae bacterium]HNK23657.1 TlpA disulfide reductase family protein [Cyclobacteriaceae bacterium]HNK80994.1 TlpA disulfide reductase family protein [Cyclobacteriaceae bacterium]